MNHNNNNNNNSYNNSDLQQVNDARKTTIINRELAKRNIDIAALQEKRVSANGSLKEKTSTLSGRGLGPDEHCVDGVGNAVRNSILVSVQPPFHGNVRIISLLLYTSSGPTHILSAYSPTLSSSAEVKDIFYEELKKKIIRGITEKDDLILLGDFNARVGADFSSWSNRDGHFGVSKLNDDGLRLFELCSFNNLCITITVFATKPHQRVYWRHPRFNYLHQLGLFITRKFMLNHVSLTRSYHNADCNTDHSLVGSKVCLRPRQFNIRDSQVQRIRLSIEKPATIPRVCPVSVQRLRLSGDIQSASDIGNTKAV
ncbi:craniofacial development protein 2 [Elysia marginata]|uniref:Craniofacial development protein 2 n=1 Tax=Elysia marginata TaxID=1093978 RepID=A0AAV4J8J7_9GAST|nr:craniofacial development protein 2 [Elysia marginata]